MVIVLLVEARLCLAKYSVPTWRERRYCCAMERSGSGMDTCQTDALHRCSQCREPLRPLPASCPGG